MKVDRRKHCAERGPADLLGRASACALALLFGLLLVWAPLAASLEAPTRIRQGHAIGQIAVKPADARQRCPKKASQGQPSACAFSGVSLALPESRSAAFEPTLQRSTVAPFYLALSTAQCCGTPPERPPRFVP